MGSGTILSLFANRSVVRVVFGSDHFTGFDPPAIFPLSCIADEVGKRSPGNISFTFNFTPCLEPGIDPGSDNDSCK